MAGERIQCPFCGESIASTAVKCRFCKEWLGGARTKDSSMARAVSRGIKHKNASKIALKAKLLLLLGGLVLLVNIIDTIVTKVFHIKITAANEGPFVVVLLVVAAIFGWRFLRQYYEE